MKNTAIIFLLLLILQSCWICPDPKFVEFDDSTKTITSLPDDYFIESVTLTKYIQRDGYIELDTTASLTFNNSGQKVSNKISLTETTDFEIEEGGNFDLLENKPIQFQVRLRRREGNDESAPVKEITFLSEEISENKTKFGTTEPCP